MKWLKMYILLSLLTLFLAVGCSGETAPEPAATAPANNPTTESNPAPAEPDLATAVPLPTTEITRTIRLTPVPMPEIEIVATVDTTAVTGELPEAIMTAVYQDLLTRENVSQGEITVTRAESIVWNDGSLGCPQPDEVYTQATVPGYWIVLAVDGRIYDYHAAENGAFILCQNSQPPSPPIVGTPNS